jgi:hypothetical protein
MYLRFHSLRKDGDIVAADFRNLILIQKNVGDLEVICKQTRYDPSMQELNALGEPDGG